MTKDIDFINNVNLHGYEIRNVSIEKVDAVPTDVFPKGKILYATVTNPGFYYCDGTKWELITGETARKALADRLDDVEAQLGISGGEGSTSLSSRVGTLETEVLGTNKKGDTDGLKFQVGVNTSDIGTLKTDVSKNKTDIATNKSSITEIDGKIGAVDYVGDSITAAIAAAQTKDTEQDGRLGALEGKVGNTDSGLVKDVADLKATVGDSSDGLVKDVADLQTTVSDPTTGLVKKVADLQTGTLKTTDRSTSIPSTDPSTTKVPTESAVASYISTKLSGVYTFKSTVANYDALPTGAANGDVYNVTAEFTYDGKKYAAGTNVVWDKDSSRWEPLTGILDTSGFQLKGNLVDTLAGGESDKYPSVSAVNAGLNEKANAATTYTKEEVDTKLGKKVDKLTSSPTGAETSATFTKVTVNAQGQVTSGEAQITQSDISGTIDTSKITSFDSQVRSVSRQVIPSVTLTEEGTTVSHNLGIQYPQVAIYDGNMMVYAAVEYVGTGSIKIYGKSTNATVTVVISA